MYETVISLSPFDLTGTRNDVRGQAAIAKKLSTILNVHCPFWILYQSISHVKYCINIRGAFVYIDHEQLKECFFFYFVNHWKQHNNILIVWIIKYLNFLDSFCLKFWSTFELNLKTVCVFFSIGEENVPIPIVYRIHSLIGLTNVFSIENKMVRRTSYQISPSGILWPNIYIKSLERSKMLLFSGNWTEKSHGRWQIGQKPTQKSQWTVVHVHNASTSVSRTKCVKSRTHIYSKTWKTTGPIRSTKIAFERSWNVDPKKVYY